MKVTFPGLLFLVFLVLKLTNVINWSWWWVTAPLTIPLALLVLAGIMYVIGLALEGPEEKAARQLRTLSKRLSRR